MTDPTLARMVGESYKDYSDRMYGRARAAERDRDEQKAYICGLEEERKWLKATIEGLNRRIDPTAPDPRFSAGA